MSEQRQEEPLPTMEVVEREDHPTTRIGGPAFVFSWVLIIAACLGFWYAIATIVHNVLT